MSVDRLDARIVALFAEEPRIAVHEAARRLGVARGTVQARLDRMRAAGIITGFGPEIDTAVLGYPVTTFVEIEIAQDARDLGLMDELRAIPEVIEAHTITGRTDLLVRVVARSNVDLQRVVDRVVQVRGVERTSTLVVLATPIPTRTLPLVSVAPGDGLDDEGWFGGSSDGGEGEGEGDSGDGCDDSDDSGEGSGGDGCSHGDVAVAR